MKIWRMQTPRAKADPASVGGLGSGVAGGLLAGLGLCPPVLAVVLGLGSSTLLVSLKDHQTALRLVAGLGLTLVAASWSLRRRAKASGRVRRRVSVLLLAVGAFAAAFATLAYIATPLLHGIYHAIFPPR